MSNPNGPKLSLNVAINKEKNKVLFAEANSDFVDVLLSFLTLPLGKVVTILKTDTGEEPTVIGCLNSLHTGLSNLNHTYFCSRGAKQMLLNPRSSLGAGCRKLAIDITDSPNNYFICQDPECSFENYMNISMYSDIATCYCGKSLNREILVGESDLYGEVFTSGAMTFTITDELFVSPIVYGNIQTLRNLVCSDTQGVEMKRVSFGIDEIRDLLKLCLTSATPLTDIIIKKTGRRPSVKAEHWFVFYQIPNQKPHSRKMVLKVCLQKSTNKFLYAEATDEFVELLFSFLTVSIGGIEFMFVGDRCLHNIDNLYSSVKDHIDDEYFKTPEMRSKLINPKLPHGYISRNQFLPLSEEAPPQLYYEWKWNKQRERNQCYFNDKHGASISSFKSCKDLYVRKQTKCIVTDDLTVCPGLATSLSILAGLRISLYDVKEMELQIGLEEALRILKASLTSKTAMTDGLIKPMLDKLPKPEHNPKQEP